MKVGVFLTNQQYLDTDMVVALDEQIKMLHLARDGGWDSIFSGQHYLNEGNNKQLQLVPFLTRLMPEAGDMTVGLGVLLLNLHNPIYVAETIATMDVICRGNLVFGVGLGYRGREFDAFNVPKGTRVKRFVEYIDLIKRLWSGETVTHHGETCWLDEVSMNIRPVQKPHPPIWVAANNDPAVRRAARVGDTWFVSPHSPLDTIARQLEIYRQELAKQAKPEPDELPVMKELFCAKDKATALELCGPSLLGKYQDYASWGQDEVMPGDDSFDKSLNELIEGRFIIGSPEQCYEQLKPYWETLGVNHLILRTHWAGMPYDVAASRMDLISKELLPALHAVP